jgi:hypothetical protein
MMSMQGCLVTKVLQFLKYTDDTYVRTLVTNDFMLCLQFLRYIDNEYVRMLSDK